MSLLIDTLRAIAGAIIAPPLVFALMILAVLLYLKNNKTVAMQKIILGGSVNSSIELTLSQLVLGIVVGTIGSIVLNSLGVIFDQNSGIIFLFITSILLMFIKPRLICFSYSGAILGIVSILMELLNKFAPEFEYGVSFNVDIVYLMMFIGVLHIMEGILVMIDGDRGAIPVFTNRDGKILGGYAFKRYWVLPIAVMTILTMNDSISNYATSLIHIPSWWPLIKPTAMLTIIATSIISILPFYAVLGYSSITFTRSKKEKVISAGLHIMVYGIILTIIAQLARIGIIGQIIVVASAPIGHEFMLKIQRKNEENGNAKFVSDEEGLTILEISATSQFNKLGLEIGNKIVSINNKSINSEAEIYAILKESLYNVTLKVKNSEGVIKDIDFKHNKNSRLGVLLVPKSVEKENILPIDESDFQHTLNAMRNKNSKKEESSNKDSNMNEDKNDKKS